MLRRRATRLPAVRRRRRHRHRRRRRSPSASLRHDFTRHGDVRMDLNRLSMDLSAAIEEARNIASRGGAGYIRPRHLLLALLNPDGALSRIAGPLGLDAAMARRYIEGVTDAENEGRVAPGQQPIASRALH